MYNVHIKTQLISHPFESNVNIRVLEKSTTNRESPLASGARAEVAETLKNYFYSENQFRAA